MISSLPKRHLPVFDNDPCAWPNWYGMFKALVDDQQLSKTQKMIYVKVSIKGTAEKAVAGMFFDGTMYDKAIAELTERFGNPTLISKSLINLFLEIPAVLDENTSSLRLCVDNLHNIAGTLKTYGHEADLRAAANMQQIITKLSPKVALRWSWKQKFKSKRCLLVVPVPKRILKKRNPSKIEANPSGSRKRRMCAMILMQIQELN